MLEARGRVRLLILALVGIVASLLLLSAPAGAADGGSPQPATVLVEAPEAQTEVRGTLGTRDESGEDVFVTGVVIIVTDESGAEVGSATTDDLGEWVVPLPGAGTYTILVDEETLPEGVPLRNPDRNPLTIDVNDGDSRPALFPLGEARSSQDNAIEAVQLFVDGIKLGLIIGMGAIGLSLIYGTTGLVNFSHGEMVTFGALMAYLFHVTGVFGITTSLIVAAVLATLIGGVAGGTFNALVWRPLRRRGASLISMLVVSIGFSILLRYIFLYQFQGRARFFTDYQIQERVDFGWFSVAPKDIFIIFFSTGVLLLVGLALQRTRAGKAMRAVADNRDLAESSGIDVELVIRWVWVSGGALAALAGVLFGLTESIGWEMGFRLLLLMFAAVTLGGLGTAYGALVGSVIVGIFIQMSTLIVPSDMKNVGALAVLIVILLVRPQGLLGRKERIG